MIMIDTRFLNIKEIENIYGDATPLTPNTGRGGKQSFLTKMQKAIDTLLQKTSPTDAERIVIDYLREYLVDQGATQTTISNIRAYLFRQDFDEMILKFWEIVGNVWEPKLAAINKPIPTTDKDIIQKLSHWNGVWARALDEQDPSKRAAIVQEVITKELLPLFVIREKNNQSHEIADYAVFLNQIMADPNMLRSVFFRYYDDVFIGSSQRKDGIIDALKIMSNIFNYSWLTDENPRYPPNLRHQILSKMRIPVCPYCNRQYVTLYREEGTQQKTTADLDHFYIKSVYPYLALCVYNFVPSCQICNSHFKKETDFYESPHLYPYTQKTNSHIRFRLNDPLLIPSIQKWNDGINWKKGMDEIKKDVSGTNTPVVKVEFENAAAQAAINSEQTFHLEEVYQSHRDYIYELIWKFQAYDDGKIQKLYQDFKSIFSSEDEVRALVFSQYPTAEDLHKRPLAKLTQDILEDCKIRKNTVTA